MIVNVVKVVKIDRLELHSTSYIKDEYVMTWNARKKIGWRLFLSNWLVKVQLSPTVFGSLSFSLEIL